MPKICYKSKRFSESSSEIIMMVNKIIREYKSQGFNLTLRQLYYQFVAHDIFPEDRRWKWLESKRKWIRDINGTKNAQPNYTWLGDIINDGRLAGLIDWNAIEDRTRNLESLSHWDSPGEIIKSCAYQYRIDKWENQEYRPEVWIEKDALSGVIAGVCDDNDVPYFSCRGYTSQSEMWRAGMRLERYEDKDYVPIIIHLGDHDPSGIDMTRDITDRLELFMGGMEVKRIALNYDQIEEFSPPPNPAKMTDSRYGSYIVEYGENSWELDALEPSVIVDLIQRTIDKLIDNDKWEESVRKENEEREKIKELSKSI